MSRISPHDQMEFASALSLMLGSGMNIYEALETAGGDRTSRMRAVALRLRDRVERGSSFYESLRLERGTFDPVFVGMVRVGEASGSLPESLRFAAEWIEREDNLRAQVRAAMLYPKIILSATFLLFAGIGYFVLPNLLPLLSGLNVELPALTRALIALGSFLNRYGAGMILLIVLCAAVYWWMHRFRFFRYAKDSLALHIPVIGVMAREHQLALLSYLASTVLAGGQHVTELVELALRTVDNERYRRALAGVGEEVRQGGTLSRAFARRPELFPDRFRSLVRVGEESGSLAKVFSYLASHYEKRLAISAKRLPVIIEPLLLIGVGIAVALIAIAIVMPIYSLTGQL